MTAPTMPADRSAGGDAGRPEALPDHVLREIARSMILSPGEAMRQDEAAAGRTIIRPGDVAWLPCADWIDDVVVSREGDEVRIVSILARKTGCGAFSRLVTGICAAGLKPVVVEPMGVMPAILTRWRWRVRRVGEGWLSESQARPRSAWIAARARLAAPSPADAEGGVPHG